MPKPGRVYVPIDVNFWEDMADAGIPHEIGIFFQKALFDCKSRGTAGRITPVAIERLAVGLCEPEGAIAGLCNARLLVADSEADAFQIPSYGAWHDQAEQRSRVKQEAGRKGGLRSAELRRESSSQQSLLEATASNDSEQEKSREEKSKAKAPSPPAPRDLTGWENFWGVYPPRNGRKVGKDKALERWVKLALEDRRAAYSGAANLARDVDAGLTLPPDAWRWLRDRSWLDFQNPNVDASGPLHLPSDGSLDYDPDRPSIFEGAPA